MCLHGKYLIATFSVHHKLILHKKRNAWFVTGQPLPYAGVVTRDRRPQLS